MLWRELGMGLSLAAVLGVTGAIRAALFATPLLETVAITMSLGTSSVAFCIERIHLLTLR